MTRCSAICAIVVVASALVAAVTQSPDTSVAKDGMIAFGVACGDGTFVPIAARTKGQWTSLSESDERVSVWYFFGILTPQGLRLPRHGWTLYPTRSGNPRPLALKSPRKDEAADSSDCFLMQAFDSDGPRVQFPNSTQRLPQRVGLGVLGPARVERGDDVTSQPDESSRRAAMAVVREVHNVERHLIRRADVSPLERFEGRKEVRSIVRLLTMTRFLADDGEWYFFQARKQYLEPYVFEGKRHVKVWASVLVEGWLRASSAGLRTLGAHGVVEDDDGKAGIIYRIVGILPLEDRTVWIAEGLQYEQQHYELFEAELNGGAPNSVLSVVTGGS
jgi:hypothetical protein